MGFDVLFYLLNGFKISLKVAFDNQLLDPGILDSDDYQMIDDPDSRTEIITRWVQSEPLKEFLLNHHDMGWNLYILTSSQDAADIQTSYLFLYNQKTVCCSGKPPDYATDIIETSARIQDLDNLPEGHYLRELLQIPLSVWESDLHWIVESSW